LLSDQGHALAVAAKLKRQIERMTKLRDAFLLQQKQAEKMPAKPAGKMPDKPSGSCQPTRRRRAASREKTQPDELTSTDLEGPPTAPHQALHKRRGPQRARSDGIVVSEALPKWGPSPRFDHAMDRDTYDRSLQCAKRTIEHMWTHPHGPDQCRLMCIKSDDALKELVSFFSNRYLQFDNVRAAALSRNEALIQVGYNRNENLVADGIVSDPHRKKFIEWAVNLLRRARAEHGQKAREITTKELVLKEWGAIPEEERKKISKRGANLRTAKEYFNFKAGVRLTMESLWEIAEDPPEIANATGRGDEDISETSDANGGGAGWQPEDMWGASAADATAAPAAQAGEGRRAEEGGF
jgi:hypothetical protein